MTILKLTIPENASDDQIRQIASNFHFNGAYATKICRNCGMFWSNLDGNYKTAQIVNTCKECFEKS